MPARRGNEAGVVDLAAAQSDQLIAEAVDGDGLVHGYPLDELGLLDLEAAEQPGPEREDELAVEARNELAGHEDLVTVVVRGLHKPDEDAVREAAHDRVLLEEDVARVLAELDLDRSGWWPGRSRVVLQQVDERADDARRQLFQLLRERDRTERRRRPAAAAR